MKDLSDQLDLKTPAQFLKGVGPQRAELLERLGLKTAQDVIFFLPRDYLDLTELTSIGDLKDGQTYRIVGTVAEVDARDLGGGRSMLGVLVKQGNEYLRAVWFNQPFLRREFRVDQAMTFTGQVKLKGFRWEMVHPKVQALKPDEEPEVGLQAVYRLTEGVSQYQMRKLVRLNVDKYAGEVEEVFPERLREKYGLLPIEQALRWIHDPKTPDELKRARYRFAFQELFTMQLGLAMRYQSVQESPCPALPCSGKIDARIRRLLPFELTAGQDAVIQEVVADMARDCPMNRMLQGDVGSGKTLVAAYAMLVAIANQHQAVMMAPTEILARQHYNTLSRILANSKVKIVFLSGTLAAAERRAALRDVESGEANLIIGTQAVVQSKVRFDKLGLAVVDEGHRFGVKQRARLRQGRGEPHYLVMTATPIPRSVAMTMFGDLDVSLLEEKPGGRQPVHTYVGVEHKRPQWWEFNRKKLREGQQAYVISPVVDEQDGELIVSVEQLFEQLCSEELDAFRVGLIHGRMTGEEKEDAMQRFRSGDTQVLVATSLVEVGVDVPNANLMTIENAERFGLAQLHQLRGRVGRGTHPGFVCAFSPSDTTDARQRLEAFAATSDGFELAEVDFKLRGPGDLFGTKQHGLPRLRVADLQSDFEILQAARSHARELLNSDADLQGDDLVALRDRVMRRYGPTLQLGDVG